MLSLAMSTLREKFKARIFKECGAKEVEGSLKEGIRKNGIKRIGKAAVWTRVAIHLLFPPWS